jgi:hypothetical protein
MGLTLVSLAWAAPGAVFVWTYPPGITFDHFVVYAKPMPTGAWRMVGMTPPTVLSITDTGIAAEQTTCWISRAVTADGTESGPSNMLCGTAPADTGMPVGCTGTFDIATRVMHLDCTRQ